jgi:entericidin B
MRRMTSVGTDIMTMRKKLLIAAVLGGLLTSLGACNTVKGVGQDIESVGRAGDRAL